MNFEDLPEEIITEADIVFTRVMNCLVGSRIDISVIALLFAMGVLSMQNITKEDKEKLVEPIKGVKDDS